jgi:hypothetical protein
MAPIPKETTRRGFMGQGLLAVGSAGGLAWRTRLVITHSPEPRYRVPCPMCNSSRPSHFLTGRCVAFFLLRFRGIVVICLIPSRVPIPHFPTLRIIYNGIIHNGGT